MSQSARILLCFAGLSLFVATALGAYASHGAASAIGPASLENLQTAIAYQFYNSLGLLAVGMLVQRHTETILLRVAGFVILGGVIVFCGAVDAHSFGAPPVFGEFAPVGGTALIAGWLIFALGVLKAPRRA